MYPVDKHSLSTWHMKGLSYRLVCHKCLDINMRDDMCNYSLIRISYSALSSAIILYHLVTTSDSNMSRACHRDQGLGGIVV